MARMIDYARAMQQAVAALGDGRRLVDFELAHQYVAYLVIEQQTPHQAIRTAAVCSFNVGRSETGEATVCVQEMLDESSNPRPTRPSGRLLDQLSPPMTEAAAAWRAVCLENLACSRHTCGPQPGDVITTRAHDPAQAQQAFYILQPRGHTSAYALGVLDGRKYALQFDGRHVTALRYGKGGPDIRLHAVYDYTYHAGQAAAGPGNRPDDLTPWETCLHAIKRRYRPREVLAFALRRPCQRFGLNWRLGVLAVGAPTQVTALVAEHNDAVPAEQPAAIRKQDCWI